MSSRWFAVVALLVAGCVSTTPTSMDRPPPPLPVLDAATAVPQEPPPPPPLPDGAVDDARRALGERYAAAHGVRLYSHHQRHLGNHDRVFSPQVATPDGGVIIVGTRVTPRRGRAGLSTAVAARLDAAGAVVWERDFVLPGYPESEGGSAALLPDGAALFVQEYKNPAWGGVPRVVKVDDAGATVWDWLGRGTGAAGTPFADVLQVTAAGTITIDGHVYVTRGEAARDWRGELDAAGALVVDQLGGPEPTGR